MNKDGLDRRTFFGTITAAGLGGATLLTSSSLVADEPIQSSESKRFAASYPVLQNVTENSASVAWALNVPSTGWVEWGPTPALGKVARNSEFGLNPFESDFLSARIIGLAPNTTYYYRTATCSFTYRTAYDKTASEPQYSDVYSFTTCGANADTASFYIMNDTHNRIQTIQEHLRNAEELNSDFILWNGDLCDFYMDSGYVKKFLANPNDKVWLERFHHLEHHLERIVTIAYLSLLRIDRKRENLQKDYDAQWTPISEIPQLAFDHNEIVNEAIKTVQRITSTNPTQIFDLLPRKFTAAQLHTVYQAVTGKSIDFRNFHKKIQSMPYVVQLEEKEQGVNHRAAHYFKFDRKKAVKN